MKLLSKKSKIILLLISLAALIWLYGRYDRHREIMDFFHDPKDLAWAEKYLDKGINFCDAPWEETIYNKEAGEGLSPSGRFMLKPYKITEYSEGFAVIDKEAGKILMRFGFDFDPTDVKWAKNERFVIPREGIYMDDDWATSQIYIGDTATGKGMYFGDSEFYECVLRNW